jgi:type I restriction enzyme S subunit
LAVKEKKIARTAAPAALPKGWRVVRFDEMAQLVNDRVDNPSEAGVERYVGLEHLDPESLKIRRWGAPTDVEAQKLRFQPGDIIFGKRRAYQRKVAVADFEGICSAHAMVLRAREETVVKDFLPFFMQSNTFFERALAISVGSLSPTINWKTLASQEFAIPPKDDQHRIAEILWAANEMVLGWEAVQAEIDAFIAATRKEIICDASYPRRRLEECLRDITPGKSVLGVNQTAAPNEFGVLKVSAVSARGFAADENKRLIDPEDFRAEFRVKADDFLITRCNTRELVGRVCIVPNDTHNLMLSDKTIRLDVDERVMTKTFLLEALRSNEARSQIEAVATGTGGAMKNISQNEIRNFLIPLPDIQTQRLITVVIESVTTTKQKVNRHIENSRSCRASLLEVLVNPAG